MDKGGVSSHFIACNHKKRVDKHRSHSGDSYSPRYFTLGFFGRLGLLWLAASLAPLSAWAQSPLLEFSLKPRWCVLASGETRCNTRIHISWRTATVEPLCLYHRTDNQLLHCWPAAARGSYSFDWSMTDTSYFELRHQDTSQVVGSRALQLQQQAPEYRQRRRNPWNFF